MKSRFAAVAVALLASSALLAAPKSGPQVGEKIPGAFNVLNCNGPAAGKSNCQV
ncbi:MAG: hypothetical protein KatS3mg105_2083 [Gemmatales bacterium]|nr:MAG: hypothetical protein KatS3mg105_2083 [Gemmatales bacterium]